MVNKVRHTELGDIPVDWKIQTFEETFRMLSNNTLSRDNLNNRGGVVRNIHYGDILTVFPEVLNCRTEEIPYINNLNLLTASTQLLQDGDVVIADTAEDDTVGKVTEIQNLEENKLVAGLHTIPCRVKKGDFVPGWLGYYMNSHMYHNQILPFITGTKVSSISKSAIAGTLILVPPIEIQRSIVAVLSKVDELTRNERLTVDKLEAFKTAQLQAMFPRNDADIPEVRFPEFTDSWEQRKLGDIFKEYSEKKHSELPALTIIQGKGTIKREESDRNLMYDKSKLDGYKMVRKNDFIVHLRSFEGGLEKASSDGIISPAYHTFHGENIDSRFYYPYFRSYEFIKRKLIAHVYGIRDGRSIDISGMKTIKIPYTSYMEQVKIGDYLDQLDNLITLHQHKCEKYVNIKKGMISELLVGNIQIR